MRSPPEAPPLLQASATSSAAAGPDVLVGHGHWRSHTVSLKAMARERRRAPAPAKGPICPACGETPMRKDNTVGVCSYCQAKGITGVDPMPTRPRCRAECEAVPRPCPFLSCRHHLYLDVNRETGSIKFNFPGIEPWDMAESCALDVADWGGVTLEEVGSIINVTRERIRQMETRALQRLQERIHPPGWVG